MSVKEQMIEILRNSDTAGINFTYSNNTVSSRITGGVFRDVAAGLESGHFDVIEGRFTENKLVYSAWANAVSGDAANTFYLGRNDRSSRDFDALVVH
jgi:hypothetical protein